MASKVLSSTAHCIGCQRQVLGAFIAAFSPASTAAFQTNQGPQILRRKRFISTSPARHSDEIPRQSRNPPSDELVPDDNTHVGQKVPKEDRQPWCLQVQNKLDSGVLYRQAAEENDLEEENEIEEENDLEEDNEMEEEDTEGGTPWYLQLQDQDTGPEAANPFAERQRLPDLPANPPPILQPLLKQVSVDLGLDYINIIDLRALDPPPALGAGLVMIFGSARSEKHLDVSADRLCRWLRSNYKLTPRADGLLGRNELKLKLRRKARRSKMLGAAGASEPSNPDDGITTGWICVNVGEVEDGPDIIPVEKKQGFVGFGERTQGARIVVQIMTEAKRGEVDLENLWQDVLDREGRKKKGERRAWERLNEESDQAENEHQCPSVNALTRRQGSLLQPAHYPTQHVKGFHTSQRHFHVDESRLDELVAEDTYEDELEPHLLPSISRHQETVNGSGAQSTQRPPTLDSRMSSPANQSFDDATAALSLRRQLDYLKRLSDGSARKHLGKGEKEISSTDFLTSFHESIPPFPSLEHWLCRIELQCYAIRLGQPNYTRLHLLKMFREMQASGIWIAEKVFMLGLEAILLSNHELDRFTVKHKEPHLDRLNALRRSLGFAFDLIEMMEAHGHGVRSESVFLLILEAISKPLEGLPPSEASAAEAEANGSIFLPAHTTDKLQHRFRRALDLLHIPLSSSWSTSKPPSDDPIYLALMSTCIRLSQWAGFWESWRQFARMGKRRGPAMYALMFSGVAASGHQAQCQGVLTRWVEEMEKENPPVRMGDLEGKVARSVLECLVGARVDVKVQPWREIAERCKRSLENGVV